MGCVFDSGWDCARTGQASTGNSNGPSNESGTGRISLAVAQVGSLSCGEAQDRGRQERGELLLLLLLLVCIAQQRVRRKWR